MADTKRTQAVTRGDLIELALIVAGALVAALLLRVFVCEPFKIPSASMTDTLLVGDRVIGEKLSYRMASPARGDIVTFIDPDIDPEEGSQTLIKRVIATEGQTVELVDGAVVVDGTKLDEPYTEGKKSNPIERHAPSLSTDISYPYTVPTGYVWVMGDNRTNSLDSRYFGAIPVSSITSRAVFRYWPFSGFGTI